MAEKGNVEGTEAMGDIERANGEKSRRESEGCIKLEHKNKSVPPTQGCMADSPRSACSLWHLRWQPVCRQHV